MADQKLSGLFVEILSKGLDKVQAELDSLKKQLGDVEAKKPKVEIPTSGLARFGEFAEKVASNTMAAFKKLGDAINSIGPMAQRSLMVATASVSGFIRAADPVGVARLQGALGAVAVQLGSIFLPLLDSVKNAVEGFLTVLRSLSDEQKDQIVYWAKVVGGIALTLAILPKVVSAFSLLTSAVRLFGVTSALATGGLTTLLGLLAAGVGAFAYFGSEGESGLSGITKAVQPLINIFTDLGQKVMSSFNSILPTLTSIGQAVVEGLAPVLAVVAQVVEAVVGGLAGSFNLLAPVVADVISGIMFVVGALADFVADTVDEIVAFFESMAEVFEGVGSVFETVYEAIKSGLLALKPVFVAVFDALTFVVMSLAKALIYVATLMKEILSGNFSGALDEAAKAVERFDQRAAERKERRKEQLEEGGADDEPKARTPRGRHTPTQQQKIDFTGLTELWRKAMTATSEDPAMRIRQEQLRLAQSQDQKLGRIADAVEGGKGRGASGPAVFAD